MKRTGWAKGALFLVIVWGSAQSTAFALHKHLRVDVAPDLTTFESTTGTLAGAFFIEGPIYPAGTLLDDGTVPSGAEPIGTFRCWGWLAPAGGFVSQEFEIGGRGKIQVQGEENERRAVVGGTQDFRPARGEVKVRFIPGSFSFRADFHLLAVR